MTEHLGTRLRAAVVARGGQQLRQALLAWDSTAGGGCVPRGGEADASRTRLRSDVLFSSTTAENNFWQDQATWRRAVFCMFRYCRRWL